MKGRVAIGLVALAAAGAVAGIGLAVRGGDDSPGVSRTEYVAEVGRACRAYEDRLERIPPPASFGSPRAVEAAFSQAVPVLEAQLAAIRRVEPPEAMRAQVERMLAASEAGVNAARRVLAAARAEDLPALGDALALYFAARERARDQSDAAGVSC